MAGNYIIVANFCHRAGQFLKFQKNHHIAVWASAVGLERRRVADFRLTTLRPCVRRADQPTLAAHSAAHPV